MVDSEPTDARTRSFALRSGGSDWERGASVGSGRPVGAIPVLSLASSPSARAGADLPHVAHPPATSGAREILLGLPLFGIPRREGRLYLTLEEGGTMSAREATESSHIHRATAYRLLLRLLQSGLIRSDGRSPQRFQAVPFDVVSSRSLSYFQDEEDLRREIVRVHARLATARKSERRAPVEAPEAQIISLRGASSGVVLQELAHARHEIAAVLRPLSLPAQFRPEAAQTLARAADRGIRVRLLLDTSPSERRFLGTLRRELGEWGQKLEVRHLCPLASHFYVMDARRTVRFSVLGHTMRVPDAGVLSTEPGYVRNQLARFETMWSEAVPTLPTRSTRIFGWGVPRKTAGPPPAPVGEPWRARAGWLPR